MWKLFFTLKFRKVIMELKIPSHKSHAGSNSIYYRVYLDIIKDRWQIPRWEPRQQGKLVPDLWLGWEQLKTMLCQCTIWERHNKAWVLMLSFSQCSHKLSLLHGNLWNRSFDFYRIEYWCIKLYEYIFVVHLLYEDKQS